MRVVTGDPRVSTSAHRLGATVVREQRGGGLNAAVELGRDRAREKRPGADLTVMVSDLPLLTVEELDLALRGSVPSRRR